MMTYDKQDAVMTHGMAILSMLLLHLFCRTGDDVYGSPLIWIDQKTPFVYWLGFFGEICVPVYTICAGYAQQLMYEKGTLTWREKLGRIFKLLRNYWIILSLEVISKVFVDFKFFLSGGLSDSPMKPF